MDSICDSDRFTTSQVRQINCCRIFLCVTLLSDITTTCGRYVQASCLKGDKTHSSNWPTVRYPRQERPDKTAWALWRKAVHLSYLRDDKRTLRRPLKKWERAEYYHHQWQWHYGQDDLYKCDRTSGKILRYPFITTLRRQFHFATEGTDVNQLPMQCFPVEAILHSRHISVSFHQIYPFPSRPAGNRPENLCHFRMELHSSLQRLVDHAELLVSEERVSHGLSQNQPLRLASDGGAFPGRASFGWVIQLGNTRIARGKGPAYGDDPRSFRAEGYGMASALVYLSLLLQLTPAPCKRNTTNILICDNQGLLTRISEAVTWKYTTPNVTLRAEWDIESVILQMYKTIGLSFVFMHVKSHQDDAGPVAGLSLEARLNVEADLLASEYLQEALHTPIVPLFPMAKCQLILNEKSVTRKIPQTIRFEAGSIGIRIYLQTQNLWSEATLDTIHWDAHGAGHACHRPHRSFLVKMCHRHLPLGTTLH